MADEPPANAPPDKLIDLPRILAHHPAWPVVKVLRGPLEGLLGVRTMNQLYANAERRVAGGQSAHEALGDVLVELGVRYEIAGQTPVPTEGPLVIVANHPFGGIEGVILMHWLMARRPDLKVMGNFLLLHLHFLRDRFFAVDPFGGEGAAKRNLRPLRDTLRYLQDGGALLIFPSGEVAHQVPGQGVTESPWSETIGRVVARSRCPVLPIRVLGRNGAFFQMAGRLHPRLRTVLLVRELVNKRGHTLRFRLGPILGPDDYLVDGKEHVMAWLRRRVLAIPDDPAPS